MTRKKDHNRVTIIIVTYNSSAVIRECLQSIPQGIKIYIVDNNSKDNCTEIARETRPDSVIIKNTTNIGFGRANNLALQQVITEFAFILNPDTVMQPETIDNLVATADKYADAAIIAPVMSFADGAIQKTYKTSVFSREAYKSNYIPPDGDLCAECLSGAAMLLKVHMFSKIGFFDPNIFLFYEDDDICLKAREAGYSLVQTPSAKLIHLMGKSSPSTYKYIYIKNWHMMWSRLYLEQKYKGSAQAIKFATREMIIQLCKSIWYLFMLNNSKAIKSGAKLIAIFAFVVARSNDNGNK